MATTKETLETMNTNPHTDTTTKEEEEDKEGSPPPPLSQPPRLVLTFQEKWNIGCLILAFSCVVSGLTLIVGTSAIVIKSVGGDTTLAPFGLAMFFLGMGLISVTATSWIFDLYGRKIGFWIGCALLLFGVSISIVGCFQSSPTLILLANIFLGAGTGLGMILRFAAVEVVPKEFASRSVAWVLCGGCLAAFAGPEMAHLATDIFNDFSDDEDNLTYLGVFVVAGGFSIGQAIFIGLVTFPTTKTTRSRKNATPGAAAADTLSEEGNHDDDNNNNQVVDETYTSTEPSDAISTTKDFHHDDPPTPVPPGKDYDHNHHTTMTTVRNEDTCLVSNDATTKPKKYRSCCHHSSDEEDVEAGGEKQSHPINRHSISSTPDTIWSVIRRPDFITPVVVSALSWSIMAMPMSIFRITMRDLGYTDRQSLFVIEVHFLSMYLPGFVSGIFIKKYGVVRSCQVAVLFFVIAFTFNMIASSTAIYTWYVGLIGVGLGWNFGFTASTVWVTKAYQTAPHLKSKVQALNEGIVFLVSGCLIFSTGFLYDDLGDGGVPGWRLLNYILIGLISLLGLTIYCFVSRERERQQHVQSSPSSQQRKETTPPYSAKNSHDREEDDEMSTELIEIAPSSEQLL